MNGKQLKNSILQWAIQGKLVPQDPNDEPASVLLERIRAEKARLVKEGKIKKDKNESIIFRGEDNSHYEKFPDGRVVCIDDEIPFEIPQGWEWCRLNHICALIEDCPHSTAPDEGQGYPLIRTPNVGFGVLNLNGVHRVCELTYNKRNQRATPKENDLIFAREAPAGNIAVIQSGEKVCLGQRTVLARPMSQHVNPFYLAYYILAPSSQINLVGQSTGTTVAHVNLAEFRPYVVALPPLTEQRRIVERIKTILPLVEKYSHCETQLNSLNSEIKGRLRKSILQEAIQGKLVPQDPTDEPATALLDRIREEKQKLLKDGKLKKKDIVDSVIFKGEDNKYYEKVGSKVLDISEEIPFEIPESWSWCRLGVIITLQSGQDLVPERYNDNGQGIPYLTGASNIQGGQLIINRWTESPTSVSHKGDLLITCKGTVGTMAYNTETVVHIARQIMSIHSDWVQLGYIEKYLEFNVASLEKAAHSIIPGISRETILNALFPLPPSKEQQRILERLNAVIASTMRK